MTNRTNEVFKGVGIDVDAAISQEGLQSIPMTMDVTEFFAGAGFRGHARANFGQPDADVLNQRRGVCCSVGQSLARTGSVDIGLNLIECADAFEPFSGDCRTISIIDFTQFSPGMHPTMGGRDRLTARAR